MKDAELKQKTIRLAYRTINWTFFGTDICDTRLRLLTRKTLFNKQIEKIHNNNNPKPSWSTDRYCKNCKKENILIEEDLSHALAECIYTKDIFSDTLNSLGIRLPVQPLNNTQKILCVDTQDFPEPKSLLLTNCILLLTQFLLMKNRTEDTPKTTEEIAEEIVRRLKLLYLTKPNHPVCREVRKTKMEGRLFENPRPPEIQ